MKTNLREVKMKKKVVLSTIVIIVILLCVWIGLRPKPLGNMKTAFTEQTTNASNFSFSAEKGDKIKLAFKSQIDAGDLEIILYDSNGNAVYVLDHAKELETFYTFDASDVYILSAEYSDFIGNFEITVYPVE